MAFADIKAVTHPLGSDSTPRGLEKRDHDKLVNLASMLLTAGVTKGELLGAINQCGGNNLKDLPTANVFDLYRLLMDILWTCRKDVAAAKVWADACDAPIWLRRDSMLDRTHRLGCLIVSDCVRPEGTIPIRIDHVVGVVFLNGMLLVRNGLPPVEHTFKHKKGWLYEYNGHDVRLTLHHRSNLKSLRSSDPEDGEDEAPARRLPKKTKATFEETNGGVQDDFLPASTVPAVDTHDHIRPSDLPGIEAAERVGDVEPPKPPTQAPAFMSPGWVEPKSNAGLLTIWDPGFIIGRIRQ